jgi:Arc/MetJ-type ribon-helix-helix transcriptional regulator
VSVDQELVLELDRWVANGEFPSRSQVVQEALRLLARRRALLGSFHAELAKLDPDEERALANEALAAEVPWPDCREGRSTVC